MKLKSVALILAFMMLFTNFSFAAEVAKGKTIRLESFSGSVEVKSGSGKDISVSEKMRVFNGYTIKTLGEAEGYLSLDDTKAVKLGNNTEVKIKKSWFSNKIVLISGELFFNVTKPLDSNESLDISTSTMSMGIRGTSGYVGTDSSGSKTQIYTGGVEFIGPNGKGFIGSWQQVSSDNDFIISQLSSDGSDIAAMVLREINNNDSLKNEIKERTGFDVEKFTEQEKINSQKEKEELLNVAEEVKVFKETAAKEKEDNKKNSTGNRTVTGKSSSSSKSKKTTKPELTWENVVAWVKANENGDSLVGMKEFVEFASGYTSSLNITGYNQLEDGNKEFVEEEVMGGKGVTGLLSYEAVQKLANVFNDAVNRAITGGEDIPEEDIPEEDIPPAEIVDTEGESTQNPSID